LAVIEKPSDETLDTLVAYLHSNATLGWPSAASALARLGSRARVALPDLKEALAKTPPNTWKHRKISTAIKTIEEAIAKEDANSRD
jgi:hypothetical protein